MNIQKYLLVSNIYDYNNMFIVQVYSRPMYVHDLFSLNYPSYVL